MTESPLKPMSIVREDDFEKKHPKKGQTNLHFLFASLLNHL